METITKVIKQTGWQLVGKVVTVFSTLVVLSSINRIYGKDGTGVYTLAATYINFFFLAADLGLNGYLLPKLSENKEIASKLFTFRLLWSCLLVVLADLLVLVFPFSTPLFNQAVWIGSLAIILYALSNSYNFIFQWKLRFDKYIIANSLAALLSLPVFFGLIFLKVPVALLFVAFLVNWILNNIFLQLLVRKYHSFKLVTDGLSFTKEVLIKAWPISLTLVLNTVYFRADAFILASLKPIADVGIYNVAYQIFQNILTIPTFIMNSYYPLMIESFRQNKVQFVRHIKLASLMLLGISVLGLIATIFFSQLVISILSGPGFEGSVTSLRILSLSFPAYFLTSLLMWVLILKQKYKTLLVIYLVGLVANVLLNFLFIPQYSYLASSWVSGISEYLILVLQFIILFKELR